MNEADYHASSRSDPWEILLLGGVSGSGKTTAARELSRRLAIPWLGVDDLRLAFQWSRVSLPEPEQTAALYFFLDRPDAWALPPERLRDGLIAVGELMMPAIDIVVGNHLHNAGPLILEGDGILPAIVEWPEVRAGLDADRVRVLFIAEPDEERLLANYLQGGRGPRDRPEAELRAEARAKVLFNAWLTREAETRGVPTVPSHPFDSLAERILESAAEHSAGALSSEPSPSERSGA